jgi:NAD-reducing hydrogenase large subunit
MTKRIIIDPVSRIEGHAKITIYLDDRDQVTDARFHVTEFRGFERFCEGRPFFEMAGLAARICGICPVSHLLASAKAGDRILAVAIPPAAVKLRRLMNLAQFIQSHALSFFHLSAPDLLLGWESDPAKRNVFGLIDSHPELARGGIRLRQLGQEIIEALGGRKIHPAWSVPGGVRENLPTEVRDRFLARLPQAHAVTRQALDFFKGFLDQHAEEIQVFGNFPSLFMGLVTPEGDWENYDGRLRFMDGATPSPPTPLSQGARGECAGNVLHDIDPIEYEQLLGERVEKDSFLKSPYYKPLGYPDGVYRVGPLARVNICRRMGVPRADGELVEFRQRAGGVANASFFFHYARLLEILACLEFLERLLPDPDLQSDLVRAEAGVNCLEGIGVSEAPRGTLFHHYHVDRDGLLTKVNLLIATGQNALAMNRAVTQIARHYVKGPKIEEPILNRVEAGIRCFDPCLSCSTHALGQMPLHVELRRNDGTLLQELRRT